MQGKGFDAALSGRMYRRSVAESMVNSGLLNKVNVTVCGDDGWVKEPERWRVGYALTPEGRLALAARQSA